MMYPKIEPFFTDMLAVSPTHSLYVERSGKKGGCPVFFVHGGPGSHSRANHRGYFDPDYFDIVLFDQRGCGKSEPAGETDENDTWALVEDINAIKDALGINRKISLMGGSWGSTLSLAYALTHPQFVEELILRGVFLGTSDEVRWYTHGLARFATEAWEEFSESGVDDLVDYYYRQINSSDAGVASQAARAWVKYEAQTMMIGAGEQASDKNVSLPPEKDMLARARVQLHFLQHQCFLGDNQLLESAQNIKLPVTIVQGGMDMVCPPVTAYRLSKRLPRATLRLVSNAGHGGLSGALAAALKEEADNLRDRLRRRDESAI
jgi:proline iminopeptidase